jgi:hypothetical protein
VNKRPLSRGRASVLCTLGTIAAHRCNKLLRAHYKAVAALGAGGGNRTRTRSLGSRAPVLFFKGLWCYGSRANPLNRRESENSVLRVSAYDTRPLGFTFVSAISAFWISSGEPRFALAGASVTDIVRLRWQPEHRSPDAATSAITPRFPQASRAPSRVHACGLPHDKQLRTSPRVCGICPNVRGAGSMRRTMAGRPLNVLVASRGLADGAGPPPCVQPSIPDSGQRWPGTVAFRR